MRNCMKKIRRSISIILMSFVFAFTSCDDSMSRLDVFGYTVGQEIPSDEFKVIVDNKNLDFPYREVNLNSYDNIVLEIIGDRNIIYQITQTNINIDEQIQMVDLISKKLRSEPERKEDVVLSNIWICDMLIWKDNNTYDNITLTNCKLKNDSINHEPNWELTITNDTLRQKLQKEYNKFY